MRAARSVAAAASASSLARSPSETDLSRASLTRAAVVGIAGPALEPAERELILALPPAGVILFQRNCVDRGQLRALTNELHSLGGDRRLPVLIDQEGGRVMR